MPTRTRTAAPPPAKTKQARTSQPAPINQQAGPLELPHAALKKKGPTLMRIRSEATPHPKGGHFVLVIVDGEPRAYRPANDACIAFFDNLVGKEIVVLAEGDGDTAALRDVTHDGPPEAQPTAGRAAAPATQRTTAPPRTNSARTHAPVDGMEVGMCLKEAVVIVHDMDGVDAMTPEFYKRVHFVASNLILVSQMLRRGELTETAKARAAGNGGAK